MMFHKGYERKIDQLVNELTLEEKIKMIHGAGLFRTRAVERLGIPPIVMSDGPAGVRFEFFNDNWGRAGHNDDGVTYCPSNSAIAGTGNWQENQERYLERKPEDVARISYLRRVSMLCGRHVAEEILSISVKIHI